MIKIITQNKLSASFALQATARVKEVCRPLTEYLGISCFGYMKIYNDCSYLALMNGHEAYLQKHHETIQTQDQQFSDNMKKMPYGGPHYFLWPTEYEKLPPIISLHNEFDIWHGFSINYRHQDYIEVFAFAFDKNSDDKSQFYLQNLQVLTKFCNYFKVQAADLIDCTNKNKLAIYEDKFDILKWLH